MVCRSLWTVRVIGYGLPLWSDPRRIRPERTANHTRSRSTITFEFDSNYIQSIQGGPEVGPTSALYNIRYSHRNVGPGCIFWASLTPFSLCNLVRPVPQSTRSSSSPASASLPLGAPPAPPPPPPTRTPCSGSGLSIGLASTLWGWPVWGEEWVFSVIPYIAFSYLTRLRG
jgi:hypothetical protein